MLQCGLAVGKQVKLLRFIKKYSIFYLMFLPVIIYYLLFHYKPMIGVVIAFKNYTFADGIWGSPWAGMKHFKRFLQNGEFWRVFGNTVTLASLRIAVTFPAPIVLALMFNEVHNQKYKKFLQTISYLPHFVSFVIVYAVFYNFLSFDGVINNLRASLGMEKILFLGSKAHYRGLFVSMALWKEVGWGAIIYLAALSRVNPELYEAAAIDGAGRLKQIYHVTMPAISPIISIQFVRTMGAILDVSFDQTLVMNNSMVAQVADVLSYYIYQVGLLGRNQFSYATAMGLFNSLLSLAIVIITNKGAKMINEDGGLW
ncbi:MAG: ABC transporter permease [Christensenellales bacterium]|jgi:putative aldouronate transport system permease protein